MSVRVALLQMDVAWHDPAVNLRKADAMLAEAARMGAGVAVLPEMFTTGFSMDLQAAEPEDGPAVSFLREHAARHGMGVIAGVSVRPAGASRGRNTAYVVGPDGQVLAVYRKMRPFPLSGEDAHFHAGSAPSIFSLADMSAGVFICYDLRFPELFRPLARRVKAFFVIANWPAERAEHWTALLRARAIENQCYVAGVNRTGTDENGLRYAGGSCVFGPLGETMLNAGTDEGVYAAELDTGHVDRARVDYPFLAGLSDAG